MAADLLAGIWQFFRSTGPRQNRAVETAGQPEGSADSSPECSWFAGYRRGAARSRARLTVTIHQQPSLVLACRFAAAEGGSKAKRAKPQSSHSESTGLDPSFGCLGFALHARKPCTRCGSRDPGWCRQKSDACRVQSSAASFLLQQKRNADAEQAFREVESLGESNPQYRGVLAGFYASVGKPDKAVQKYLQITTKYPDDLFNKHQLTTLYMGLGRTADAEKLVESILKDHPSDAQSLLVRGELQVQQDRIEEGLKDLQRASQTEPRWALAHYYVAIAQLKRGELKLAEPELRSTLELDPNFVAARVLLAEVELKGGKVENALAELDKAISRKRSMITPYIMRSLALAQQGEFAEAEKGLLPSLQDFPQTPERAVTYRALSWIKFHQKKYVEARKYAEQACMLQPTSPESLYLLGMTYLGEKQIDAGLRDIKARVDRTPQWAEGQAVLGRLYGAAGRLQDAEQYLKKSIEIDPKVSVAWLMLGDTYVVEGKSDQALDTYTKLVGREPKSVPGYLRIGQVYEKLGHWDAAENAYKKVLELDPDNVVAKNNLAWQYAEHSGNIDVALRLAQEAKQAQPDNPAISDTLGWIYVKKQTLGNAIQLLKESVDKSPNNPEYQFHLGVAYFQAGRNAEAKESLETTLRRQPNFPQADDAKKMLASLNN